MDQSNPEMTNKHTINSLFELHTALGGINCVDSKGNYSEFSNEVVVNFMNAVGHKINESVNAPLDQDNYIQPLKQYHIGYALNNTAVKMVHRILINLVPGMMMKTLVILKQIQMVLGCR